MFTISNILEDVDRGILANNMIETCFVYRIVYYTNENGVGTKNYVDTSYNSLREELENIIRRNLSTTNTVVIAAVTVRKDGKSVCLQSRSYGFSLDEYFEWISGECRADRRGNIMYSRYAVG